MTVARRMGPAGSETWLAMVNAAEHILQERGYGELTSRSVAEHVGVKQRLVYYYFRTMDELIVETFKQLSIREMQRFQEVFETNHSPRAIWKVFAETTDTKLVSEFMALANRSDALREQVTAHIEEARKLQVAALEKALTANGRPLPLAPVATIILATATALALHREAGLGVTSGHAEVFAAIEQFIDIYDPE